MVLFGAFTMGCCHMQPPCCEVSWKHSGLLKGSCIYMLSTRLAGISQF